MLTPGEDEAGLAAADVLATWWGLEERWLANVGHLVKTVMVCQSAGSS